MSLILIVIHDQTIRETIGESLSSEGYEICTAMSDQEISNVFKENIPSLIVTNLSTSLVNGFNPFLDQIQLLSGRNVPFLFVLEKTEDPLMLLQSSDAGTCDFIRIPYENNDLLYKTTTLIKSIDYCKVLNDSGKLLCKSEVMYHTLFNNVFDAIYLIDPETEKIIECNSKAANLIGYDCSELKAMTLKDLHPVDEQDVVLKIFDKILEKGALSEISGIHILRKDGTRLPVEINATSVRLGSREYCLGIFRDITERRKTEKSLKESEEKYRLLVKKIEERHFLYIHDVEGVFTYISPSITKILGYSRDEFLTHYSTYLTDNPCNKEVDRLTALSIEGVEQPPYEVEIFHKNGDIRWIEVSESPILDNRGIVTAVQGIAHDITERKNIADSLKKATSEWEQTFDTIPDFVSVIDNNHRIIRANKAIASRLGVKRDELIGRFCYEVVHRTTEPPHYCPHSRTLEDGQEHIQEVYEEHLNGHFLVSATPIHDNNNNYVGVVEVARDITDRKKMEETLREAAIKDSLTGLFNRRGFFALGNQQCKLSNRSLRPLSLLFLDLDGMKTINDELGHKAGDQALIDTANILLKTFRESDIISRIGGDEFAVLLTDPSYSDIDNTIKNHLDSNITNHNREGLRNYVITLSIGISHYDPANPCSIDELIARADHSMYENKRSKCEAEILKSLRGEFDENRLSPRYATAGNINVKFDGASQVQVKNISREGVCLTTPDKVKPLKSYQLVLSGNSFQDIAYNAELVWASTDRDTSSSSYESGYRITEISETAKNNLKILINSLVH